MLNRSVVQEIAIHTIIERMNLNAGKRVLRRNGSHVLTVHSPRGDGSTATILVTHRKLWRKWSSKYTFYFVLFSAVYVIGLCRVES